MAESTPAAPRMHDDDVMRHMRENTKLNQVRQIFSGASARIDQAAAQRRPLTGVELRRMEFEAVRKIAAALGVEI